MFPLRGVIFWQGRLPKPAEHKAHQVDLLAPRPTDPYGKRRWRESLIPNIIVQYERLGFTVVKPDEIKNRLHHSYNPPEDIQRAKLGFGVWLEASCGCRGRINLDGEAQAERLCDNEVCPWKTSFPLEIGRPKVEKPNYCGDCPGQILKRTYQARGNWRRIIEICPFHGEVNIGPWEL